MDNSQTQSELEEEMSSEQKTSRDLIRDGSSSSHRQTFGREGGGGKHHRLVILCLGLLNVILLIAAVVIGIYCAKAQDYYRQAPNSAVTQLMIEMKYLRNHSALIKARTEAETALAKEHANQFQLKMQMKEHKTLTDRIQGQIETLQAERTNLRSNKTSLEQSCGRCLPGWIFLKSTCYYFSSRHESNTKKNWFDSRADCINRGSDLLVISNLEEQQVTSDNLPTHGSSVTWWENGFWIGLTVKEKEGTWVWVNNVTEVETMYWRTGQPNHEGPQSGNCAAFYHYVDNIKGWYNGNCHSHLFNWICEMRPS